MYRHKMFYCATKLKLYNLYVFIQKIIVVMLIICW